MKKSIINKCLIGIGILSIASCSDPMEEITNIIYDREFSPINLEVKNVKETSALLKWKASTSVSEYTVELYPDDSLTFTSTPISVNIAENEMQLENLTYDTRYSVKVIAKDTKNPSRNSKAATLFFRTGAQQIFKAIEEDNIGDRSVVVSWAEEEKDVSEIRAFDQTGALIATHTITDAEKNSCTAKVDGLSPETKYTLKLYYNSNGVLKERGSKTFTTIVDLDGAILVRPTDDIADLVANAKDGDVFALTGGTFVVNSSTESVTAGVIVISKNVTIKGIRPTRVPVINGRFQLDDGASLTINQVNIDGEGTTGDQCFNYKGTNVGGISVDNAEIKNFKKGVYYVNVPAKVPYIKFNNCLIHDIVCEGGDMLDCRTGCIDELSITNSTIYNSCAERDFVRFDDASEAFAGATPKITIDHCTINAAANKSGKRLLYVRFVGTTINWTNNIVTNTTAVWSNQSKTSVPTFGNNNFYFNCDKLNVLDGAEGGKTNLFIDEKATVLDPQYVDAAAGNFTLKNESVSKFKAGDPRWYSNQ